MASGKQEVERFRVGDRWLEPSTGIIRTITWADNAEEQDIHYTPSDIPGSIYPVTGECFRRWIEKDGYVLLPPETPDADRLDVPRDCTGRWNASRRRSVWRRERENEHTA
jgi:hypothetical protein